MFVFGACDFMSKSKNFYEKCSINRCEHVLVLRRLFLCPSLNMCNCFNFVTQICASVCENTYFCVISPVFLNVFFSMNVFFPVHAFTTACVRIFSRVCFWSALQWGYAMFLCMKVVLMKTNVSFWSTIAQLIILKTDAILMESSSCLNQPEWKILLKLVPSWATTCTDVGDSFDIIIIIIILSFSWHNRRIVDPNREVFHYCSIFALVGIRLPTNGHARVGAERGKRVEQIPTASATITGWHCHHWVAFVMFLRSLSTRLRQCYAIMEEAMEIRKGDGRSRLKMMAFN